MRESREEKVYLQLRWRRDELTDQLHLVGSIRTGVKRRREGKKRGVRSEIISHSPDLASKSCKHSREVKPQIWSPSSATDRDATHLFCMHLRA